MPRILKIISVGCAVYAMWTCYLSIVDFSSTMDIATTSSGFTCKPRNQK